MSKVLKIENRTKSEYGKQLELQIGKFASEILGSLASKYNCVIKYKNEDSESLKGYSYFTEPLYIDKSPKLKVILRDVEMRKLNKKDLDALITFKLAELPSSRELINKFSKYKNKIAEKETKFEQLNEKFYEKLTIVPASLVKDMYIDLNAAQLLIKKNHLSEARTFMHNKLKRLNDVITGTDAIRYLALCKLLNVKGEKQILKKFIPYYKESEREPKFYEKLAEDIVDKRVYKSLDKLTDFVYSKLPY